MDFKLRGGMPGMPQLPPHAPMLLIVPGVGFILFGVTLIFNAWLLVYMVAGIFLLLGGLLTMAGLRAKKMLGP